jgi:hypothetical protein
MWRRPVGALVLTAALPFAAHAQPVDHPSTITVQGVTSLGLAAQATRVHLLGLVEFYDIALYVEAGKRDRLTLGAADVAKALRIRVRYTEDLRRRIALDWRRELVPLLDAAAATHLHRSFAAVQQGDVVLIEYAPRQGTTVRVNKAVAVAGTSHDLMLSFLDHWLGQRPVSEEIKRALLGL